MEPRTLGRTALRVSAIGFGARGLAGDESIRAVHRALDLGCTFFDADTESEALLGKALRDLRPAPVVAARGAGTAYPALKEACELSLARLRRDAIDLYLLDAPALDQIPAGIETLFRLKAAGMIRYGGISIRRADEGMAALDGVDAIEAVYHMLDHSTARGELFANADAAGVAIIARDPLAGAGESMRFLAREDRTLAQSALRFVLANEHVDAVVPDVRTVAEAEETLRALSTPALTMSELEQIFELTAGCGEH